MDKILFDHNNFKDIHYLNFDSDFAIKTSDKSSIILGPNGTGKTSIYLNIKNRYPDYSYIDYNEVEQSVISKKNKLYIGASILKLDEKYKERDRLISEMSIKENLSIFSITNSQSAKLVSSKLDALRKNPELAILQFDDTNLDSLFSLSLDDAKFIKENYCEIKSIEKIETNIKDIKDSFKIHILEEVEDYLSDDEKICPICGTKKNVSIKKIISSELSRLSDIKDDLVKEYCYGNYDLEPEVVLEKVNGIINMIKNNNIDDNNIINYFICGGSRQNAKIIKKNKVLLKNINDEISMLESEKDKFYKNLLERKDSLINIFRFQFDVEEEDISFIENDKCIEVKLPRKVENYSTGEKNLMTFVVCMMEFISSNKEVLIIDDPLSSYDIPNQYKIIYEIAASSCNGKYILVFTHNINTINIANSQHNGLFSFSVLEKRKNTLYINHIDYYSKDNLICIQNLINNLDDSYLSKKYIELLMKKDTWDDSNPDQNQNHLIFHYDEPFSKNIHGYNFSNDFLFEIIDKFDENSICNTNYIENTANKIILTASLRIWIEKQFYLITNNDSNLHNKEFGEKVKYLFTKKRWSGPTKVTKDYLMSKKVMLNQHIHQKSQEMPFYFALNLSLDDVVKEIIDIKNHFK